MNLSVLHLTFCTLTWSTLFAFSSRDPAIRDQRLRDHDHRKTRSRTRSRIEEIGHFLQFKISRKTIQFLKKKLYNFSWSRIAEISHFLHFTISRKTRQFLKKKLYNFSWSWIADICHLLHFTILRKSIQFLKKTIQFLVIANCRNRPLPAFHDLKINYTISQEKLHNFSWSRIAEIGHFLQIKISRKTIQIFKKTIQCLVIAVCRN